MILQTLLELGMGQAIIQFISNEWGKLDAVDFSGINFKESKFRSIIELFQLAIFWYTLISILVLFIILPGGYLFFSTTTTPDSINWLTPWIFLCLFLSGNTLLLPFFYFLQGCNKVKSYWLYRFLQQGISGIVALIAIISGAALYTYAIISLSLLITSVLFLTFKYRKIIVDIISVFNFKFNTVKLKEVWSLQWKIAISSFTTIYTIQVFVPFLFKYQGPVIAGQMGMSITLINIILAISSNWFIVNAPSFGILVSQDNRISLDKLFKISLTRALISVILGSILMLFLVYLLKIYYHPIATRILPLNILALLSISILFNTILLSFSTYFRAHKKEPLIFIYAFSNVFLIITIPYFAKNYGVLGLVMEYLIILSFIQLPLGIRKYFAFKEIYNLNT
jgi:hypothetical protein